MGCTVHRFSVGVGNIIVYHTVCFPFMLSLTLQQQVSHLLALRFFSNFVMKKTIN